MLQSVLYYGGAALLAVSVLYGSLTVKLLALLLAIFSWSQLKRPSGIPPGPRGVPILGYIPFIIGPRGTVFSNLAKKYGNTYSIYLGKQLTIVLNDYADIRKALVDNGEVFSGRPEALKTRSTDGKPSKSIFSTDGPFWREHRRFALSTLREYGVGKSSIEPALQNEIDYFLKAVNDEQGKPFNISDLLGMSVCNNICILEFGKRFDYHDKFFLELKHAVDITMRKAMPPTTLEGLLRFLWLRVPFVRSRDKASNSGKRIEDFCKQLADEHLKVYQPGSTTDYIDAYYTEKAQREKDNNKAEMFDYETLYQNLNLLFFAGTETTATTLRWGLLYMLMHPDIQRKVQQEIDEVVGRQRLPSMEDKLRLPYTEATLLEILRRGTILSGSVPHSAMEDVEFGGYHFPKGAAIMTNLWAVHMDEKLFPDPYSFRPERFINERGQFVKHEGVVSFSMGKRFCLGEPLARMELFLYFTAMLQKFTFTNPEGQVLTDVPDFGLVRAPKQYRLCAIRRGE